MNLNIRLMYWFKKSGRTAYLIIFALLLIETAYQGIVKGPYFVWLMFLTVTLALIELVLEAKLLNYSNLGSRYVESGRALNNFNLEKQRLYNEDCFVGEIKDEYVVKMVGQLYIKSYKKDDVTLEEKPEIEIPRIEITTIKRISEPSTNKYSIFAETGDITIEEQVKIIVRNIDEDVEKIYL